MFGFNSLFKKKAVRTATAKPDAPVPEQPRALLVSEPVISLGESLLILDDWTWDVLTSRYNQDQFFYVHVKHELKVTANPSYIEVEGQLEMKLTFIVKDAWMSADEKLYIGGKLVEREVLREARAEQDAERKRNEERNKFFVLVNQLG